MATHPESFTEQLLQWGNSGSLYPSILPSEASTESLRLAQSQLAMQYPDADIANNLHATLFYLQPRSLYEHLVSAYSLEIDEARLYMELSCVASTAAVSFKPFDIPVEGLGRFGPDGSSIAAELSAEELEGYRRPIKELMTMALGHSGVTPEYLDQMQGEAEYQWSLGISTPHITLLNNAAGEDTQPEIELPETLHFNRLRVGGVKSPSDDPMRWLLMGF